MKKILIGFFAFISLSSFAGVNVVNASFWLLNKSIMLPSFNGVPDLSSEYNIKIINDNSDFDLNQFVYQVLDKDTLSYKTLYLKKFAYLGVNLVIAGVDNCQVVEDLRMLNIKTIACHMVILN